jgi:hypothetical protein
MRIEPPNSRSTLVALALVGKTMREALARSPNKRVPWTPLLTPSTGIQTVAVACIRPCMVGPHAQPLANDDTNLAGHALGGYIRSERRGDHSYCNYIPQSLLPSRLRERRGCPWPKREGDFSTEVASDARGLFNFIGLTGIKLSASKLKSKTIRFLHCYAR